MDKEKLKHFSIIQHKCLVKAKELDKKGELLNILSRTSYDDSPVYNETYMDLLLSIYIETNSIERVEKAAILNKNYLPVYDIEQIEVILKGHQRHFGYDDIDFYIRLNSKGEPIFSYEEMDSIYQGIRLGLTLKEIEMYAKLNKNGSPIYNCYQMNSIRYGLIHKLTKEKIEIYSQLDKNGDPMFSSIEMNSLEHFIRYANEKQLRVLKDAINDKLSFGDIFAFLDFDTPAENLRIFSSLYKLGCDKDTVEYIAERASNFDYEHLKEIKYMISIVNKVKELDETQSKQTDILTPMGVVYNNLRDLDKMREELTYALYRCYKPVLDIKLGEVLAVKECIEKKINTEAINLLITSDYNEFEIKNIANVLLKGYDFNKIKELREEASQVLSAEEIKEFFESEYEELEKEVK